MYFKKITSEIEAQLEAMSLFEAIMVLWDKVLTNDSPSVAFFIFKSNEEYKWNKVQDMLDKVNNPSLPPEIANMGSFSSFLTDMLQSKLGNSFSEIKAAVDYHRIIYKSLRRGISLDIVEQVPDYYRPLLEAKEQLDFEAFDPHFGENMRTALMEDDNPTISTYIINKYVAMRTMNDLHHLLSIHCGTLSGLEFLIKSALDLKLSVTNKDKMPDFSTSEEFVFMKGDSINVSSGHLDHLFENNQESVLDFAAIRTLYDNNGLLLDNEMSCDPDDLSNDEVINAVKELSLIIDKVE